MKLDLVRLSSIVLCASVPLMALNGCGKVPKQGSHGETDLAHSTAWYQEHPDALRADEKGCAGETPRLSREACRNLYAAENALGVQEMQDAARHNNDAAQQPKTP